MYGKELNGRGGSDSDDDDYGFTFCKPDDVFKEMFGERTHFYFTSLKTRLKIF